MTRLVGALAGIARGYDGLLCDLWGCLHDGRAPFPAAVAALRAFRAAGGRVVLLTNAPRPNPFVARHLAALGVPDDAFDAIVSSGDAAQAAMIAGAAGRRVWHLGPAKDEGFFAGPAEGAVTRVPLDQAEGIVATGPFEEMTETPEDYRARFAAAIARGLPMLCANPDLVVDVGPKRIYCAGALAALYAAMGGTVHLYGKPHPPVYDLARDRIGLGPEGRLLAIGDGIATDIAGAVAQGIDSLFVTGGLAAAEMGPDIDNPDPARLDAWLAGQGIVPTYAIGKLR